MQEPGELKGKEGGSKEGKQRGSQVSNARRAASELATQVIGRKGLRLKQDREETKKTKCKIPLRR